MRHRLDKEGGHHLFSIPDQDVNNVPPSKQTGNSPQGNTIVLSATHNTFSSRHAWIKPYREKLRLSAYFRQTNSENNILLNGKVDYWHIGSKMERQRQHSWKQSLDKAALSFSKRLVLESMMALGHNVTWENMWPTSKTSTTWETVKSTQHLYLTDMTYMYHKD